MADVLQFPASNPRCINCRFWRHKDGNEGDCERLEELTNSDYRCDEHKARERGE